MSHVSKKKLSKETLNKLSKKLLSTFEDASRKNSFGQLFKELFTKTEKIMLTKRLIIIILLSKEIPQHWIVDMLHVSPSTVAKMSLNLEVGKYNSILKIIDKKNSFSALPLQSDTLAGWQLKGIVVLGTVYSWIHF